ncbi:MAG TPA: FHA domain-containing protein, partial [Thermoanaerobaculia bacterium]
MPARLVVHPAEGPVVELSLAEDREHVVGRDAGCSVPIDDDRVSRRHARLTPLGGGRWQLADLGSKNGSTVDGRPVARAELAAAAWLGFGGLLARFDPAGAPSPEAAIAEELRRRRDAARLERRLDPAAGLEPLLDRLLTSVLTVAGAERCFVVLARRDGGFEVAATAGPGLDEIAGGVTAHGLGRGGAGGAGGGTRNGVVAGGGAPGGGA